MRELTRRSASILFWAPRILCIAFAVFTAVFALDVLGEGYSFWETALALLMHMIPTALVLLVLLVAWRWEWIGGVLCGGLGVFYIGAFWGRFPLSVYVTIAGPLFVMAALFLLNWQYKTEIRTGRLGPGPSA